MQETVLFGLRAEATLRFNVPIGCQRIAQLLRADWSAFWFEYETRLLRDSKGRGGSREKRAALGHRHRSYIYTT